MHACRSYNHPEPHQTREVAVLTLPYRQGDTKVCVDACLAPAILALWAAGIETFGSCCGHEDDATPEVIIGQNATAEQIAEARRVLATVDKRSWAILSWTLARYEACECPPGFTCAEHPHVWPEGACAPCRRVARQSGEDA